MLQAAELLFGAAGRPHDYLQEALFRLLAVGFLAAASENWVLKVQQLPSDCYPAASRRMSMQHMHVMSANLQSPIATNRIIALLGLLLHAAAQCAGSHQVYQLSDTSTVRGCPVAV